jgi:hypothetical protein
MKSFAILLLFATLSAPEFCVAQSGYFSEIKISFTHQTALLPASAVLTAGPNDGSYLICAYLEQTSSDTVGAVLDWTDENGNPQSAELVAAGTQATSGCTPIRNKANTAPTIQTVGEFSYPYNLYVDGFGFWNVGPDKQGGITEPIVFDVHKGTETFGETPLLLDTGYDTYLIAMTLVPYTQLDNLTATLTWYDANGLHSASLVGNQDQDVDQVFLVRTIPNTYITLSTTGTVNDLYDLHVHGLHFGTPATGTGPMAFYGHNLLHWINPASYAEDMVPPGMWLMAANAEYADSTEALSVNAFPLTFTVENGADGRAVGAVYEGLSNFEGYYTYCGQVLICPLYSAEFDLVVF